MEQKRSLSVNQRLLSIGAAAILGFGAMVGVGWLQNRGAIQTLEQGQALRNDVAAVQELRIDNLSMVLAAMDSIVDKAEKKVAAERITLMSEALDRMKQAEGLVGGLAATIGKPELAQTYSADIDAVRASVLTELPNLIEQGAADAEFAKIDDTIDGAGERLSNLFAELAREGKAKADGTVNDAKSVTENALYMQILLGLVGIAVMSVLFPIHSAAIRRGVYAIRDGLERMRNDDLDTKIEGSDRGDEFGDMARAAESLRHAGLDKRSFAQNANQERDRNDRERSARDAARREEEQQVRFAVDSLANALARLADGDLTIQIDKPFREDLERVREDFNRAMDKLQSVIAEVKNNSASIEANASQMRGAADDLARRTEQQAASLEQTSAALEEITATVKKSSERAGEATRMVDGTKANAQQSSSVVSEAMNAMERIETASNEIGKIINVIDEIAFQTNLLALNAGVEAARAGEAGKGFAVVAQEVRELAGRAAGAAKDIKTLVARSSGEVKTGVELVTATRDALVDIASEVSRINEIVREISTTAQEQSVGIQQINSAINQMDQMTQQNAAMVEETNAASHTLAQDAGGLTSLMKQFQISATAGRSAAFSSGGSDHAAPQPRQPSQPSSPPVRAKTLFAPAKPASEASRPRPSPAKNLVDKLAGAFGSKTTASAGSSSNANNWEEF
ncbi:methyl-accepting chemotaxis protein [Rhizobium sp. SG_E_25_P2]|uniref:methyl-accepting chemotaxis protein n=1 Tax=Rhizobium sp. SG_E_25_P2 TaxID=2879942 RepID=UPI0024739C65|nr:methyl-accepting chemotaxis protein [Rhizobium sp. SG_E_25_P2]MDH6267901.1 methyl-accepting chemotaxis protein [Rhizobium sp. SG_E_25_P2]